MIALLTAVGAFAEPLVRRRAAKAERAAPATDDELRAGVAAAQWTPAYEPAPTNGAARRRARRRA